MIIGKLLRYYDAETGRFISRDIFKGFEEKPESQNAYVYCENDPVNNRDPNGTWTSYVHYDLTRIWAYSVGFSWSRACTIAYYDKMVDSWFPGGRYAYFHFALYGAYSTASYYLTRAISSNSLRYLGYGLHALQDAICHGWLPWQSTSAIDYWGNAPAWKRTNTRNSSFYYLILFWSVWR